MCILVLVTKQCVGMNSVEELELFAKRLDSAHRSHRRLESVLHQYPSLEVEQRHKGRDREWIINKRWRLTRKVYAKDVRAPFKWEERNRLGRVVATGTFYVEDDDPLGAPEKRA